MVGRNAGCGGGESQKRSFWRPRCPADLYLRWCFVGGGGKLCLCAHARAVGWARCRVDEQRGRGCWTWRRRNDDEKPVGLDWRRATTNRSQKSRQADGDEQTEKKEEFWRSQQDEFEVGVVERDGEGRPKLLLQSFGIRGASKRARFSDDAQ